MGGIEEETAAAAAGPADSTLPNAMGLTTVRMPSLEQHDEGGGGAPTLPRLGHVHTARRQPPHPRSEVAGSQCTHPLQSCFKIKGGHGATVKKCWQWF